MKQPIRPSTILLAWSVLASRANRRRSSYWPYYATRSSSVGRFVVAAQMPAPILPSAPSLSHMQLALSAILSYCIGTLVSSPLDVIKTHMQISGRHCGIVRVAKGIFQLHGLRGFWKGILPALSMAPGMMIQYSIVDVFRTHFQHMPIMFPAAVAGAIGITLNAPFENMRVVAMSSSHAVQHNVLRHMTFAKLWTGYSATLCRDVPYIMIYWTTYQHLRVHLGVDTELDPRMQALKTFVGGMLTGAIACAAVTPLDVMKTCIQSAQMSSTPTIGVVARAILARDGPAGFFRGLSARLVSVPLYSGVCLAVFELCKTHWLSS